MNVPDAAAVSLGAALLAGLAGSGHCLGMCGGIAGALALRARSLAGDGAAGGARLWHALAYNLARVASYAVAGALAGLIGGALLQTFDIALLSIVMRVVAGAVMVAAAGRVLFGWRLLDPLEGAGARLWRRVLPGVTQGARRDGLTGAITLGLAWGWLPCGLSYSMLLLAATTAAPASGALVMAAFGVGTLPAMVGATLAFERAARLLAHRASLRHVAGGLLLAFGVWTAGNAVYHGLAHAAHGGSAPGHDEHTGHQMSAPALCAPLLQAAGGTLARDARSDRPPARPRPPE